MKKLYILTGIIVLQCLTVVNAAQMMDRQKTRTIIYREVQKKPMNWDIIFTALDNSRDPVDVNTLIIPMTKSTLLEEAVIADNGPAAQKLIEKYNANSNAVKDESGITAMMLACMIGNPSMVELLLQHGGNPHLMSRSNKNSFYFAARHPVILQLLESYKAQ